METISTLFYTYKSSLALGLVVAIIIYLVYRYMVKTNESFEHNKLGVESFYQQEEDFSNSEETFSDTEDFKDNTEDFKDKSVKKLVLFSVDWCPHCRSLTGPDGPWPMLRRRLHGRNDIKLISIDGDKNPELTSKYGIGGFPTIKLFHNGKVYDFSGDRTLANLERFVDNPES